MQEEQEFDIYYRGSTQELISLLFPLHPPSSAHFQQLSLTKASYQPKQQSLEMRYSPTDIPNVDNLDKEVVYNSRKINNRTNYFYSVLSEDKKELVWTSINSFLQMRPTQRIKEEKPMQEKKQSAAQRRFNSYDTVMQLLNSEAKKELKYVEMGSPGNKITEEMKQAVRGPINKSTWKYTKDEYIRCLSK